MWLYLPPTASTSSASAPVAEASTLDLSLHSQRLEASLWWRGKPSPSRTWLQRCSKVFWLQQLSGAMCGPSTAARGAVSWMASLAASRASRTPSPERSAGSLTSETFGATPDAPSSRRGHGLSSSKTSAACSRPGLTKSLAPAGFAETYSSWVMRLRADCSRRQKLATARAGNASSYSQWLTPDVPNGGRGMPTGTSETGMRPDGTKAQVGLQNQATRWPTPKAGDPKHGADFVRRDTGKPNSNLQTAIAMWPTPNATDGEKGSPGQEYNSGLPSLTRAATVLWPTPQTRDFKGADQDLVDRGNARPLNEVAVHWSTPRASDGEKGGPGQSFGTGEKPLAAQTIHWPGPTSLSFGESHQPGNSRSMNKTLDLSSRLDHRTKTDGAVSSSERRSLNPLFVEWLMGWPPLWVRVSTNCGCSAMALLAWRQRMRSALLSLASPQPAPPAQLSLLG